MLGGVESGSAALLSGKSEVGRVVPMGNSFELPPIRCFLSYRRVDNNVFRGVVDRLKDDISGRFEAMTGRSLQIFVDRDDIGWGANWKDGISDSIRRATFFMPVLTARYFDSPECCEEFLLFHENAKGLGVTELIMPIILAGESQLREAKESEPAGIALALQTMSIEEAFLEGFDSACWNKRIHAMVSELGKAFARAEKRLAERESRYAAPVVGAQAGVVDAEIVDDDVEFSALSARVAEVARQVPRVMNDFEALTADLATAVGEDFAKYPAKQIVARLFELAQSVAVPAASFKDSATSLQTDTATLDVQLRKMFEHLGWTAGANTRRGAGDLVENIGFAKSLDESRGEMERASGVLQMAAALNLNLNRAVRPALQGARSLATVLDIMAGWQSLADRAGDAVEDRAPAALLEAADTPPE